jgi:glycosyltransferase involved in cell wall biosynthesis
MCTQKILFVTEDLGRHGVSASLTNLLHELEQKNHQIDLLVFSSCDETYRAQIPASVRILPTEKILDAFYQRIGKSLLLLLRQGNFIPLLYRLRLLLPSHKESYLQRKQKYFQAIIKKCKMLPQKYDVAIGFQDYFPAVFITEKVKAAHYITWNHNTYEFMGFEDVLYRQMLDKTDRAATISVVTKKSLLAKMGPSYTKKVFIVPNCIQQEKILQKAKEELDYPFFRDTRRKLLSIGRLTEQKGFDFALVVAEQLKQGRSDFCWYIIGEGPCRGQLETLIKKKHLEEQVQLLGFQKNPYPFLRCCDIYVQPSRFEGYGIAVDEARALAKPLIATDQVAYRFREDAYTVFLPFGSGAWKTELEKMLVLVCSTDKLNIETSFIDVTGEFEKLIDFGGENK